MEMTIASHSGLARRARYGAWLGVVVALSSLPARASDQITFVSQGGAYQKAQTVAILDPAAKKLDITKLPNAAAMPENYRSPYSVAYEFYSSVLAYSQTKYPAGAAPDSWADFWDVKKFPGRRALRNHPLATLEAALMADGVAPDELYPLDVDRAFKKLEQIKPYITVWWTSGAQSAQLLNDGEVDMVMAWNGRVSALAG